MIWEATFFARGPQEREIPRLTLFARDDDPGRIVVFSARANKAVRHSRRRRIPPARSFTSVRYILSWWSSAAWSQLAVSASLALRPPELSPAPRLFKPVGKQAQKGNGFEGALVRTFLGRSGRPDSESPAPMPFQRNALIPWADLQLWPRAVSPLGLRRHQR
jgi:hypothetical protein